MQLFYAIITSAVAVASSRSGGNSFRKCGMLRGAASDAASFPWLTQVTVTLGGSRGSHCPAAFVSPSVVLCPAHCVAGHALADIRVGGALAQNALVHPDFERKHPAGLNDVALVSVESRPDGFYIGGREFACLPETGDDPLEACTRAKASSSSTKSITLQPSVGCLETPFLRGYVRSSESIVCAMSEECGGNDGDGDDAITFCPVGHADASTIVGLPSSPDTGQWCRVGAQTRVAAFSTWIKASLEYLESSSATGGAKNLQGRANDDFEGYVRIPGEPEDDSPCSKDPCGANAVCWNSGENFMCTCDPNFPEGNPYYGCSECLYDQHCQDKNEDAYCSNKTCVYPPPSTEVPPEFNLHIGERRFYVSQESLPWPQAQYDCLSRQGHLAEIVASGENDQAVERILQRLMWALRGENQTGLFWVGASDFEEQGKYRWFRNGGEIDTSRLEAKPEGDKDQRCIQVSMRTYVHKYCNKYPF